MAQGAGRKEEREDRKGEIGKTREVKGRKSGQGKRCGGQGNCK
jgi:hypothetical protein